MKEEALKKQTTASRPIKALTVYPPNTPAMLVPRVLPTKSQVKINIFALIQLFSKFEKTCKKRITPTGLTEGERGFEQTKDCYLTVVIPFFKTLKEHFEGIQKALTKEIKEMKDIFKELEAEVDQNVVNRKHDEIERKKLLIANDNLIADCLSKEVFYIATNSELIVSRFTEIHKAHTIVQTRCLELEAELFKLQDKLKYQNLKESFGNNPSPPARDTPDFDSVFESVETLHKIVEEAKVERPFDRSLASACLYTKHSQELLEYAIGTCPKDFNQQDKKHAPTPLIRKKQVTFEEQCDTSNSNTHKHVEQLNTQKTNVPVPPSTGVNCCTNASGSQPRSNTKKNRISPAKGVNKKKVEEHPRTNKSNLRTTNRVDSSSCSKHITRDRSRLKNFVKKFIGTVRFGNDHFGAIMGYGDNVIGDSVIFRVYYVEGLGHNLFSVGQFCNSDMEVAFRKHSCYVRDTDDVELIKGSRGSNLYTISVEDMMKSSPICLLSKASKNKSWLWHRRLNHLNFGTINDLARKDLVRGLPRLKFEKDHLCSCKQLMEREYILVIVDGYSRFTWVKFLRSKDETPKVVIKLLKEIQVILNKTIRYIRTDNGTEFVNKDLTAYYERVGIFHQMTVPRTPQQNDVVERQNRTLVEAAKTMLIFSKALIEDLGKLQPTADIGIFVGYAPSRNGTGPAPSFMMLGQISSGLVPNPVLAPPYVPPTNKELDILFQPMFDEYLEPPYAERPVSPTPAVLVPINSASTPSSTTIDQDAPSPSHSPSSSALQSLSLHQGVAVESTLMEDNPFPPVDNDPFVNMFSLEPSSEASSSGDISSAEFPYVTQTLHHLEK
ncbi:retrovirus-related pol polyprotein from transposon TNT 1-94 [Tanacetum coccineum]